MKTRALAGVAQWTERRPENQGVTGSIPSQGICLGCRLGPQWGEHKKQPHIDVSLPLFLSPFPSLQNKRKKIINCYAVLRILDYLK